jgi:nitroimidazol reductase NimA-like FMN-containing flavoprotein (pyridoxamine 5'-phosphate oxidase superfamily)
MRKEQKKVRATRREEEHLDLKEQIQRVLDDNWFAVLATQHAGQPHASLMAFTPVGGVRYLVFATYRDTLKHRNLVEDGRVALLIGDRADERAQAQQSLVLTALGNAIEIPDEERAAAVSAHLARHPDLQEFVRSPNCVLMRVAVVSYQVVGGIGDVRWYQIDDPSAT